jgi:rSAM/selenodomain-associated transferase 2
MSRLSIVVPVLNEAAGIAAALRALAPFRQRGAEVVVADGSSTDATVDIARPLADRIVAAPRGRASQMNAGAAAATGDVLLFLHADTSLPDNADGLLLYGLADTGRVWGRFDVKIEGRHPLLHMVAGMMNWRSQITGIATGDQAMFVTREAFTAVGGFPDIPLMEDVALSKRLKRLGRPLCLAVRVRTSGRRWEQRGVVSTILLMWRLRLAYWLGAEPAALARRYGYVPRE